MAPVLRLTPYGVTTNESSTFVSFALFGVEIHFVSRLLRGTHPTGFVTFLRW